ncbi:reverse transcriptase rnase h [Fusarium mundagurra]|uniref:Reverse transcriptase rnase h n=1 Tax=Fusarium mundagurra TaxID=1567541 RepID=A0A8H5Z920_9HYPO|nr:reverse transcriptase rnase h [Fusarium mundagurra]
MAYTSSEHYSESPYPHYHAFQTSASSLLPPFYLDSVASAPVSASQDCTDIGFLPTLDVSTPSADPSFSTYPNHGSVPDPHLYYWPFWDPWSPWSPWEANYGFPYYQEYAGSYILPHQTAWETAPFASTQDALQHQSSLPYLPESASFGAEIIDLSFLPPDERYIVQLRLKNEKWKLIQAGYAKYWKPMTISGLAMKLGRIRKRNKLLEYIIPAKPHKRTRTSSTKYAISSHE